jgi:hypothetical protein
MKERAWKDGDKCAKGNIGTEKGIEKRRRGERK